ncbi:MAG: primosomal protein N' [Prevotellaceae bacterium]|nr:primosomal protein N' [Prevotellaceae bacterium]
MPYVDVILPLPLQGTFTYALPAVLEERVSVGMRVLVPLGKSKRYIAIVVECHDRKPDFDCKEILEVLDEAPILLPHQLTLWRWMSDYYMAPLGDVMTAALPGGLKTVGKYRPKKESYIRLTEPYRSTEGLQIAKSMLLRAQRQQEVFETYLRLAHIGETTGVEEAEVTKEELLNEAHTNMPMLKNLIDRGILETYDKEVGRLNTGAAVGPLQPVKAFSPAQQQAYEAIHQQFRDKQVVLLHGVTSSGKTEIYLHLIEETLKAGKQVLYLLPEIALTVQMMTRLQRVLGDQLGIYHSKYSDAERVEIWKKQLSDEPYSVILGARSALFLPFRNLGLVIIDEEHETSFKQQEPAPRYHARSSAIMLAHEVGAKVLLGTATPSMESYYNAQTGKYGLVTLSERYQGIQLPEIEVVDVKDLRHRKMMTGAFSPQLLTAIRKTLAEGNQVILFQNRRGFAPMIECRVCGWTPKCQNCDVSLTLHKRLNLLVCHYCGTTYRVPDVCPNCGSTELSGRGYGTEKIEDQIRDLFPEARVARMDLDTTRSRHAYSRLINDFSSGRTNLLIGTQMVTKGLDFERVKVVGILDADVMLNQPDFRAYEHAFTMMSQVAGRAGRKGSRGKVFLQTKNPDLPVIRQVVNHDYPAFYHDQMEERSYFHYPPFYHLIDVYLRHPKEPVVEQAARELGGQLRQWFGIRVLGPDKPAVGRIRTLSIRKIVLKLENGIDRRKVREYLHYAQERMEKDPRYGALQIYFDVDPG